MGTAPASLFELPLLATHGAVLLHLLCVQPFEDAVHVEAVGALSPHQGAVIARHFTVWTTAIKRHPADATVLIIGYPEPSGYTIPALNFHLHGSGDGDLREEDYLAKLVCSTTALEHFSRGAATSARRFQGATLPSFVLPCVRMPLEI